jgi:anti-sigma28 factor (negative regulator of flagellin synthesis)
MTIRVNDPQAPSSTSVTRLDADPVRLAPKRGASPSGSDAVQLSGDVRLADEAVRAADVTHVRPDAVARARALLEQGQLGTDLGRLADRIIDSLGDYDDTRP